VGSSTIFLVPPWPTFPQITSSFISLVTCKNDRRILNGTDWSKISFLLSNRSIYYSNYRSLRWNGALNGTIWKRKIRCVRLHSFRENEFWRLYFKFFFHGNQPRPFEVLFYSISADIWEKLHLKFVTRWIIWQHRNSLRGGRCRLHLGGEGGCNGCFIL